MIADVFEMTGDMIFDFPRLSLQSVGDLVLQYTLELGYFYSRLQEKY